LVLGYGLLHFGNGLLALGYELLHFGNGLLSLGNGLLVLGYGLLLFGYGLSGLFCLEGFFLWRILFFLCRFVDL